jgi:hypothetical protein
MKKKSKAPTIPLPPPKTKEDFLRWLKKRRRVEKIAAEKQKVQDAHEMKAALMVWVDDGGPPA